MHKQTERLDLIRVHEFFIMKRFLMCQGINEEADFSQRSPDCIVPSVSLVIEVTSVQNFEVARTLYKSKERKELELKYDNNCECEILIQKIKNAIEKKDTKPNYSKLPQYEKRVLIVQINGICFDWRKFEIIAQQSNFSDLKLRIFNSVYLVVYPVSPTKDDIDNKRIPPLEPNFIRITG